MNTNEMHQFYDHINVLIKPTDGCNLRCKYCFHQDYGYNPHRLSLDMLEHFFDISFPHYKSMSIVWHGGEPTFVGRDYFEKCIEISETIAKRYGVTLEHSMQTNGTLLSQDFIDLVKKYKVGVGISYDGPANDYTRGSSKAFDKTYKLMSQNGLGFGVISVVSGVNVGNLIDLYEHMKELGLTFQINPYIDTSVNAPKELNMSSEEYLSNMVKLFNYWIDDSYGKIMVDPFGRMLNDIIIGQSNLCARSSCMRNWVCLNADGMLSPCDRDFPAEYQYGNVMELDDLRSIYESEGYLNLMSHALVRRNKCMESCDVYELCEGGCNNDALYQSGLENNGGFSCKTNVYLLHFLKQWLSRVDVNNISNPTVRSFIIDTMTPHNIKGSDGTINELGVPGVPSTIIDCREESILENIEEGIISTVKKVLAVGLLTVSSCQGHEHGNPYRCISIIAEEDIIKGIQHAIANINMQHPGINPIKYSLLEYNEACKVYKGEFKRPKIIDIIFGDCRDESTPVMQMAFEDYLDCHTISAIKEIEDALSAPYILKSIHTDVYS